MFKIMFKITNFPNADNEMASMQALQKYKLHKLTLLIRVNTELNQAFCLLC